MPSKPPILLRSGLTGSVYIVTAYTDHGDGRITAKTKHDVTEQFEALVQELQGHRPGGTEFHKRTDNREE